MGNRNGMGNMHNMNAMGMQSMGMHQQQHHMNDKPAMSPYANHGSALNSKPKPRCAMLSTERRACAELCAPSLAQAHSSRATRGPRGMLVMLMVLLLLARCRCVHFVAQAKGDEGNGGPHVADARPRLKMQATWRREERRSRWEGRWGSGQEPQG